MDGQKIRPALGAGRIRVKLCSLEGILTKCQWVLITQLLQAALLKVRPAGLVLKGTQAAEQLPRSGR